TSLLRVGSGHSAADEINTDEEVQHGANCKQQNRETLHRLTRIRCVNQILINIHRLCQATSHFSSMIRSVDYSIHSGIQPGFVNGTSRRTLKAVGPPLFPSIGGITV